MKNTFLRELEQKQKKPFDETRFCPNGPSICALQNESAENEEWYRRIKRSTCVYIPGSEQSTLNKKDIESFLQQSLLFEDEIYGEASHKLFESLLEDMTEFSTIIEQDPEFSFLAFTPRKSGSMREQTKTFAPNEFDLNFALKNTNGLRIIDQQNSQSAVQVDDTADKRWKALCIENSDILCPKKLKSKFMKAMIVCCGIAASEHDHPEHTEEQTNKAVSKLGFPGHTEEQTDKAVSKQGFPEHKEEQTDKAVSKQGSPEHTEKQTDKAVTKQGSHEHTEEQTDKTVSKQGSLEHTEEQTNKAVSKTTLSGTHRETNR